MECEWDEAKRQTVLRVRGLDFARVPEMFCGDIFTSSDERYEYGEERYLTYGEIDDWVVLVAWTPRGSKRRIITMRNCHDKERTRYYRAVGR